MGVLFTISLKANFLIFALELKSHPAFPSHLSDAKPDQELPKLNTKQHLSRELRLYFDRVTSASFSDDDRAKNAALASLSGDPGLHQLVPYLVQFVAEKVISPYICVPMFSTIDVSDALCTSTRVRTLTFLFFLFCSPKYRSLVI